MLSDLFWPSLQLFCTLIFTDFLRGVKYLTMSQFFPPTPKLSPPRVQKPQEIFHCHPTAVALPLCLCAYMPLPPWWSTYQMIIHMSAQLLCCQTCAHWPWRGVPFPQLINSLSLCWALSAHWVVCDGVMVSMAQLSDCAASLFFWLLDTTRSRLLLTASHQFQESWFWLICEQLWESRDV